MRKKLNIVRVLLAALSILFLCENAITVLAATTDDVREIRGEKGNR